MGPSEEDGKDASGCPTEGEALVTLLGTSFTDQDQTEPLVYIRGLQAIVVSYTQTNITCHLPPGTGAMQTVRVSVKGVNSSPKPRKRCCNTCRAVFFVCIDCSVCVGTRLVL